jgi:hypothetical protein
MKPARGSRSGPALAARVVEPCGRIGILHVAVPFPPPGCVLIDSFGISSGCGFRMRALTVFERSQDSLFEGAA